MTKPVLGTAGPNKVIVAKGVGVRLGFYGAAGEVSGSCYLLETAGLRFLVDCGMWQGGRDAGRRNRKAFPFEAASIDFVLLTHAHIDHSGLLPKLVRAGFKGPVYATPATIELLEVMLPDSAHINEKEARRDAQRAGKAAHAIAPLYTVEDAYRCLKQTKSIDYDRDFTPARGVRCRFRDAGHILGSAIIEMWLTEPSGVTKLVFSGDLGQPGRPIVRDPAFIEDADLLLIESTYGDRLHKNTAVAEEEAIALIRATLYERAGNVIMPSFAVGRAQQILYYLHRWTRQGHLRDLKIFVDSPMASEATRITRNHLELFDEEARRLLGWHAQGSDLPYLHFVGTVEESIALNKIRSGAIIIAASGMCDAGRVRHHLRHNLPRPECSVLIPGFQAERTLGRRLLDGAKQVRLFGQTIPVRAGIYSIEGFSAHADQQALLNWAGGFKRAPAHTFVMHGELPASHCLARLLNKKLGWQTTVPQPGQQIQWPGFWP